MDKEPLTVIQNSADMGSPFTRLQFGGVESSRLPAARMDGGLGVRTIDDSRYLSFWRRIPLAWSLLWRGYCRLPS